MELEEYLRTKRINKDEEMANNGVNDSDARILARMEISSIILALRYIEKEFGCD